MKKTGYFLLLVFAVTAISCKSAEISRRADYVPAKCKTIQGRIITPDGQPVAGAEIHIYVIYAGWIACHFISITNQNGEYVCSIPYFERYQHRIGVVIKKEEERSYLQIFERTLVFRPHPSSRK